MFRVTADTIMCGFCLFVLIKWIIIPFIQGYRGSAILQPKHMQTSATHTNIDEEVTVEDMVLHDMMNESDVYDIGVIDFNE